MSVTGGNIPLQNSDRGEQVAPLASSRVSAVHPIPLTPSLISLLDVARRVPSDKVVLQIAALQARVWAADASDMAVRPWYLLCLELYPRGTVINHAISELPGQKPPADEMFLFLLRHISHPPEGEKCVRPTDVSFIDASVTQVVAPHLTRIGIRCDTLTLADGAIDYIKRYSDRLVERGRATRSDAAERPSLLSAPHVTPSQVGDFMKAAVAMFNAAPWTRIPEHVALQIRLPSPSTEDLYRQRYYVTILGSDKKVFGFALVASLTMLRDKYRRVMGKRTGDIDSSSDVRPIASDVFVCAACGRRVGEDSGADHYVNRCAGCHRLLYCDEKCQRADWRLRHRGECQEARQNRNYLFRREQWAWLDRELALLFLDPTAIPFDDLDAFSTHSWQFVADQSPPLYPLAFASVQASDGVTTRRGLPTAEELVVMTLVAQGLTECVSTPPSDGILHLANGTSISLAENLAESIPVSS